MKRFLYTASVRSASGTQTFFVDAESRAEADERAANGDTDGISYNEVEVTDLTELEFESETTTDDFGDYPEQAAQVPQQGEA